VTPEEIRNITETIGKKPESDTVTYETHEYGYSSTQFVVLREIAAQLAEQNAIARESIDMRKADDADMKAYREQALRTASETKDLIQAPTRGPIVIPTGPQDTNEPQHLGCFLLLPDGSHGIAVAPGIIIQMDPEDARRIIAAISKPPEGKPS